MALTASRHMSSTLTSLGPSLGSYTERTGFAPERSSTDPSSDDAGGLLQPNQPSALIRHYTTLQEHADQLNTTEQDDGLTPRNVSRREGISWGQRPSLDDQRKHSRNPIQAEQERPASPPPLEEIIRKNTIEDADYLQNNFQRGKLQHVGSMDSQPSVKMRLTASFSSDNSDCYIRNGRRTSVAAFAKGIAKHAHDFKMFNAPERRWSVEDRDNDERRDSHDKASGKSHRKDRVLSFAPLPPVKSTEPYDKASKPSVVVKEPFTPEVKTAKPARPVPPAKGSLRDRRKVNLDLSMPKEMPGLPARGRSPVDIMASLGVSAPRPRSPKTPWVRNEEPKWAPRPLIQKSTPIIEEDYIRDNISASANDNDLGKDLLPGTDAIFSSWPKFERPPPKVRDRCYISRPSLTRNRSGRSDKSGTSSSTLAVTPEGSWTHEKEIVQERQVTTNAELQQLYQNTPTTRSRRWLWKGKTSSEDAPQSPSPEQAPIRRFSINPFKRSNRISDQTIPEVPSKATPAPSTSTRPGLLRGKQSHPATTLANMHVPPTFIPPGVHRVPTPPMFDAQGEVKGKLADFFFDVQGGVGAAPRRNKHKSSPGGYWDSDALLMSLTSDIDDRDDEEEEEGPEGPKAEFEVNGTPSLTPAIFGWPGTAGGGVGGYLGVKPPGSPSLAATSPILGHDGWFRIAHDPNLTPDDRTLTALARQEEEDRRKFEWLVPEHLPNSPLCPLHAKYKGPSKNLCYWHGRRSKNVIRKGEYGTGGRLGSSEGGSGQSWSLGGPRTPMGEVRVKKRRLVSLSSP